jgi:hypothetical protein
VVTSRSLVRAIPILALVLLALAGPLARRLGGLGLFLTLLLFTIAPLHAQRKGGITPQAIGPGVAVSPDAATEPTRAPNSGDFSVVFTVFNVGTTALNLDIS